MTVVTESRDVPFTPDRMFALVADIESYPEFLPEYDAARIERREGTRLRVRQILRVLGRQLEFITAARLHPPESIEIIAVNGPFRSLSIRWTFRPLKPDHCRIRYRMDYEMESRLLGLLVDRFTPTLARRTLAAFERRARELYG